MIVGKKLFEDLFLWVIALSVLTNFTIVLDKNDEWVKIRQQNIYK